MTTDNLELDLSGASLEIDDDVMEVKSGTLTIHRTKLWFNGGDYETRTIGKDIEIDELHRPSTTNDIDIDA
jgi:hypothetical protein